MRTIGSKILLAFLLLFALGASAQTTVQVINGGTDATTPQGADGNLGVPGPELNVVSKGAVGDCSSSGSTASCTDNCTPLTSAFAAARAAGVSVYFPINNLSTGPTVYYSSCAINFQGVSFHAALGSAGQSVGSLGSMSVAVRGAPGKDVFDVPDPGASAPALLSKGFTVRDIGIIVDATVNASSSGTNGFPNRLPGRTCFDAVANGTTVITSAVQCQFQPGDVGQAILVNSVSTTVASWQSVNQVTLSASVTSGSSLTAYISVDGLSTTQTVGNCAFAMDASGLAGGYGNGPLRADFTNVVMGYVGSPTNYTCGYFFQGNLGPYQTKWDHDFLNVGEFGFVFAMPNTAAALVGGNTCQGMCDYNEFDNTWIYGTYPWISYGGNVETIKAMQISNELYGPQILTGNGAVGADSEDEPSTWSIDIPEMETVSQTCPGGTPTSTFRITGHDHVVDRLSTGYCSSGTLPTFQWDASQSTIAQLDMANVGTLAITGNHNTFSNPFYPVGTPLAYSITGVGNLLNTCTSSGTAFGQDPGRCQYTGIGGTSFGPPQLARGSVVFNRTHDFMEKGAPYYFNDEDLWLWPREVMNTFSAVITVPDSSSSTGAAISITSVSSYILDGSNGTDWVYGSQIPAGKVRFYVMAKANTSLSWEAYLAENNSVLCAITPTLTTSYSLYYCDADATAYSGIAAEIGLFDPSSSNTVSVAWIGIKPWFSDLEVNGSVNATSFINPNGTILPTTLTGTHGTDLKLQTSDGTGTSTHLAVFDANGGLTDGGAMPSGTPIRAGTWSISSATSVPVVFSTAMGVTPTSCSVSPTASSTTTGQPYPTSIATTGFTVNVPNSGTIAGTYQCEINNAN